MSHQTPLYVGISIYKLKRPLELALKTEPNLSRAFSPNGLKQASNKKFGVKIEVKWEGAPLN